jgi:hypothetical protein
VPKPIDMLPLVREDGTKEYVQATPELVTPPALRRKPTGTLFDPTGPIFSEHVFAFTMDEFVPWEPATPEEIAKAQEVGAPADERDDRVVEAVTTRRTFLAALAATLVLDPERELWVPGRKTWSIPAARLDIAILAEITCTEGRIIRLQALFDREG